MTNHDMLAAAMQSYFDKTLTTFDKTLTTNEIKEIVQKAYPQFSDGSVLPNDHASGNKSACWCVGTEEQIFEKVQRNKYRVLLKRGLIQAYQPSKYRGEIMPMGEQKRVIMQPENLPKIYEALFQDIDGGQIKLPMFQRDFVWDKEQTAKLIDSILKGFPIGTFIFWKTRDELRSYRNLGNHPLPVTPKGDYAHYILDGQQRITSLYAVRKGIRITRDGKVVDYRDIYIDLECVVEEDEQIVVAGKPTRFIEDKIEEKRCISVHDALTRSMIDLEDEYAKDERKLIDAYQRALTTYSFSTIVIKDYPIEIACEVFSRINTGGKTLSVFEIMVAKTYDESKQFDLAEQYSEMCDGVDGDDKVCLRAVKFETIPESVIMQCVAAIESKTNQVRGKDILQIKRENFIANWIPMKTALFEAVDFIRHTLRIPASQILPYSSVVVPLTYFFHKTKNKKPSGTQRKMLEQWFYWVGLHFRYSSGAETKLGEDLVRMDKIIVEEEPRYPTAELHIEVEHFMEWEFGSGADCKTVLCALAYHQPKSFDSNALVNLDNSNLKIATSKNYHHFFPKAYLAEHHKLAEPNLMANITLIDGYLNKHKIGKLPPSQYIAKFEGENDKLSESLESHLIGNLDEFGITKNDYETFIEQRSRAIVKVLNKKLKPFTA